MPTPTLFSRVLLATLLALALPLACNSAGDDDDSTPEPTPEPTPPPNELDCGDSLDEDEDGAMDCEDDDCLYVAAQEGACLNQPDMEIYRELDGNAEWNACVPTCFTDVECNQGCVAENTGLSDGCSRCFAELIECFILECGATCQGAGQGTPECTSCVAENCSPAYDACFGVPVCEREFGCLDTADNDGDGDIDRADSDCDDL